MAGDDDPETGSHVSVFVNSPLLRSSWARPPVTPGEDEAGPPLEAESAIDTSVLRSAYIDACRVERLLLASGPPSWMFFAT
jgi:hypothetical protein